MRPWHQVSRSRRRLGARRLGPWLIGWIALPSAFAAALLPDGGLNTENHPEARPASKSALWSDIEKAPETPQQVLTKARLYAVRYFWESNPIMVDSIAAEVTRNWEAKEPPLLFFDSELWLSDLLLGRYPHLLDSAWVARSSVPGMVGKIPPESDAFSDSLAFILRARFDLIRARVLNENHAPQDRDWLLLLLDRERYAYERASSDTISRRLLQFARQYPEHPMRRVFEYDTPVLPGYSRFAWGGDLQLGWGYPSGEMAQTFDPGFAALLGLEFAYGHGLARGELTLAGSDASDSLNIHGRWRRGSKTTLQIGSLLVGFQTHPLHRWSASFLAGLAFGFIEQDTLPAARVKKDPKLSSGSEAGFAYAPVAGLQVAYRFSDRAQPRLPRDMSRANGAFIGGLRWFASPWHEKGRAFRGDYWQIGLGIALWRRGF